MRRIAAAVFLSLLALAAGTTAPSGAAPSLWAMDRGNQVATRRLQAGRPAATTVGAAARPVVAATSAPSAEPAGRSVSAQLDAALATLASLTNSTVAFWAEHGPDTEGGGFFTFLNRFGAPDAGGDKLLVPTARQLYAWATVAQQGGAGGTTKAQALALAKRAYDFLTGTAMWDAAERQFAWRVSRDGSTVVHPEKVLYGQAFAILGLARYARAAGDGAAADLAWQVFSSVDAARHDDQLGGYLEEEEAAYPPGVGTGDRAARSQNTHLHLIEALTELSAALGAAGGSAGSKALVDARLAELLSLVGTKLYQPATGHLAMQFRRDWSPVDPNAQLLAHELELVYFVAAAARQLATAGALPADVAAAVQRAQQLALEVGARASQAAWDPQRGGFWEKGYDGKPSVESGCGQVKAWWPQFEGMLGSFWLWQAAGDGTHLQRLLGALRVLQQRFADPAVGEFFAYVDDASSKPACGTQKADEWKANYHSLRGLLYAAEWLAAARAGHAAVPKV